MWVILPEALGSRIRIVKFVVELVEEKPKAAGELQKDGGSARPTIVGKQVALTSWVSFAFNLYDSVAHFS